MEERKRLGSLHNGYIRIHFPEHPRSDDMGLVYEHVLIASDVLGKSLPLGAVVHHIDGDKTNNSKNNLIICQNERYHQLIHRRTEAYKSSGHVNWRRCRRCKVYDHPDNMTRERARNRYYHSKDICRRLLRIKGGEDES
jgi:hypothetical protein